MTKNDNDSKKDKLEEISVQSTYEDYELEDEEVTFNLKTEKPSFLSSLFSLVTSAFKNFRHFILNSVDKIRAGFEYSKPKIISKTSNEISDNLSDTTEIQNNALHDISLEDSKSIANEGQKLAKHVDDDKKQNFLLSGFPKQQKRKGPSQSK